MTFLIINNNDNKNLKECVIEIYHCTFCGFKESHWNTMQDHYYFNHEKELHILPGERLDRKIDLLIINGEKSFVSNYF